MKIPRLPIAAAGIVSATAVIAPSVMVAGFATLGKNHGTRVLPQLWAKWVLAACGADVAVVGMDRFDHKRNYVMVSNHVSLMDAPAIVAHAPQKVRFVAKKSLFYVPVFGQALWAAGNISVDRAKTGSATRKLREMSAKVGKEISVLFFPEGTRSAQAELMPFKKGATVMAIQAQVPVLPIAVAGTEEVLPKSTLEIRPGVIGLAFGKPIDVAGYTMKERDAFTRRVREAVAGLKIEAEAARQTRIAAKAG
ncbi:lysophospholipid acyltransferase family protein [Vulgatibacter sp.]|uniref:lysophospholipid acyltransferase family protein n=1 Tax=Vulgatibacter sp. TaxID=1971226 RepID=UPI003567A9EB